MAVARYGAIRNIRDEDPYRYLGGTPGLLGRKGPYRGLMGPRQYQGKANIPRGTKATKVGPEEEQYKQPDPLSMYTSGKEAYDVTFGDAGIFTKKGQAQMGKQFDEYGKQVSDVYNKAGESFDELWGGVGKWFGGADEGLTPDIGLGRTRGYGGLDTSATEIDPHWMPQTPLEDMGPWKEANPVNPYAARNEGILTQAQARGSNSMLTGSKVPGNSNAWSNVTGTPAGSGPGAFGRPVGFAHKNPWAPTATSSATNIPGMQSTAQTAAQAKELSQMTDLVKAEEVQAASNLAKGTSGFGAAMGGVTAALSAYDMIENGASVGNVTGLMGGGMVAASFFSPALAALGPWGAGIAAVGAVGSWMDWW